MSIFDAKRHLEKVILPYWNNLTDNEFGGFYGFVGNDLKIDKKAVKGVILHSRILWFYSNVYMTIGGQKNKDEADHAFAFLSEKCFDNELGGLYWMMKYDGKPESTVKNAYNQAFGIYGLASYYKATGNKKALALAYDLFRCIEGFCTDEYGYLEEFSRDWKKEVESAICDQGISASKTMNSLLHIMEAYTELLDADRHPSVARRLLYTLQIAFEKVYYPDFERLEVFFDEKMKPIGDIHSYGHDIEASWLIDRACDVLENNKNLLSKDDLLKAEKLIASSHEYTSVIAEKIYKCAFKDDALNNESRGERSGNTTIDTDRIWWVQAETVVGFYNEYQKHGDKKFLEAAELQYKFINDYQVDKRPGSEWFWYLEHDGKPKVDHGITEAWKCPYHNGRMCLELIKRGADK